MEIFRQNLKFFRNIQPHQLILSYNAKDKLTKRSLAFYYLLKVQYRNSTFHNYRSRYKELAGICGCGESTIRTEVSRLKEQGWAHVVDGKNLSLISRKKIFTKLTGWRSFNKVKFHSFNCGPNYKEVLSYFDAIIIDENLNTQKYAIAKKIFVTDKKTEEDFKKFYDNKEALTDRREKFEECLSVEIKKQVEINVWNSLIGRQVNTDVTISRGGFARTTGISKASASRRMSKLVTMGITEEEPLYVSLSMPKEVFCKMGLPSSCFWFKGKCYRRLPNRIKIVAGKLCYCMDVIDKRLSEYRIM